MPLASPALIQETLETDISNAMLDLEVFVEFPTDEINTSEGLYVARFYQQDRRIATNSLQTSGATYEVIDRLEMYLIQPQLNPNVDAFLDIFSEFIDDPIFEGYFKREYVVDQLYRKNNESYRIIFSLTRMQILN